MTIVHKTDLWNRYDDAMPFSVRCVCHTVHVRRHDHTESKRTNVCMYCCVGCSLFYCLIYFGLRWEHVCGLLSLSRPNSGLRWQHVCGLMSLSRPLRLNHFNYVNPSNSILRPRRLALFFRICSFPIPYCSATPSRMTNVYTVYIVCSWRVCSLYHGVCIDFLCAKNRMCFFPFDFTVCHFSNVCLSHCAVAVCNTFFILICIEQQTWHINCNCRYRFFILYIIRYKSERRKFPRNHLRVSSTGFVNAKSKRISFVVWRSSWCNIVTWRNKLLETTTYVGL